MADDLIENIRAIYNQTVEGKISWQKQSPTLFIAFVKQKAQLVIQRAGASYVFRVINMPGNQEVINVSSSYKPELEIILRGLFNAADKNVDSTGARFLGDLLG